MSFSITKRRLLRNTDWTQATIKELYRNKIPQKLSTFGMWIWNNLIREWADKIMTLTGRLDTFQPVLRLLVNNLSSVTQISGKAFTLETLDRKTVPFEQEIKESCLWLRCVPAPDRCQRWRWRVQDGKLELREWDTFQIFFGCFLHTDWPWATWTWRCVLASVDVVLLLWPILRDESARGWKCKIIVVILTLTLYLWGSSVCTSSAVYY